MLVLFGAASGPVPPVDPQRLNGAGSLFLTRPTLFDYITTPEELRARAAAVYASVADGTLDVRIGHRYPLADAARRPRGPAGPPHHGQAAAAPLSRVAPHRRSLGDGRLITFCRRGRPWDRFDQPRPSTASAGLFLLDAQHGIVLSGGENRQETLRRYAPAVGGPPGQVVVELGFAPLPGPGLPQTGRSGIDARIAGQRIGELSQTDAAWYRPLLERAVRHGLRPGCEAHVVHGGFGMLELEIYLPVVDHAARSNRSASRSERAARPRSPGSVHPTPVPRPVWWVATATLCGGGAGRELRGRLVELAGATAAIAVRRGR